MEKCYSKPNTLRGEYLWYRLMQRSKTINLSPADAFVNIFQPETRTRQHNKTRYLCIHLKQGPNQPETFPTIKSLIIQFHSDRKRNLIFTPTKLLRWISRATARDHVPDIITQVKMHRIILDTFFHHFFRITWRYLVCFV